jgi:predicted Zn-ribbon and HTH transcriptional regulator
MKKLKCKKCNYKWLPRTKNPIKCPKCCSYEWNGK